MLDSTIRWSLSIIVSYMLVYLTISHISGGMGQQSFFPPPANAQAIMMGCEQGTQGKICNIELSSDIQDFNQYRELFYLLQNATQDTTVVFHLSGNGGFIAPLYAMYNNISNTKANVIMQVDGPVSSAHAFLAFLGGRMVVHDTSYFMFHLPAFTDSRGENTVMLDCSGLSGVVDRGQSMEEKCHQFAYYDIKLFNELFKQRIQPYLTQTQIKRYYQGYDVYVSSAQINKIIKIKESLITK